MMTLVMMALRLPFAVLFVARDIIMGLLLSTFMLIGLAFFGRRTFRIVQEQMPHLTTWDACLASIACVFQPLIDYGYYAPIRALNFVVRGNAPQKAT